MKLLLWRLLSALHLFHQTNAGDNGAARTPPMGWRSWNFYACEINASVFERQIDALADRSRTVDSKPTSLADLGYTTVGIDDCWQDCLSPASINGSYHDKNGNPLVDGSRFPGGLRALSDKAASRGIALGWYGNNCPETRGTGRGPKYCSEHGKLQRDWSAALTGDVAALIAANFSAVKLDNPDCGAGSDMQSYYDLVNRTAKYPITIENCHYNTTFPHWIDRPGGRLACPMSLFRVSNDIKANWATIMRNVHATIPFADAIHPMSSPGCWSYPDMLEVGVSGQNGHSEGGLSEVEEKSHFGLWAVVSSPLTLSFDLGDSTIMDRVWNIISNPEVLAVNRQWFGHPGTLSDQDKDNAGTSWQIWSKPQGASGIAVLLLNRLSTTQDLSLKLENYVESPANVRDLWARKNLGVHEGTLHFESVASHDSMFLLLTPTKNRGS